MYFEAPVIILPALQVAAEPNCGLYLEYAVLIKHICDSCDLIGKNGVLCSLKHPVHSYLWYFCLCDTGIATALKYSVMYIHTL